MKRMFKSVGIALAITSVVGLTAFAANDQKGLKTGTVYGTLYGGSGYANAKTVFSPEDGHRDKRAYVFIGAKYKGNSYESTDESYGGYNAWISLRDTRATSWHSAHSSTGTDDELWLWIED